MRSRHMGRLGPPERLASVRANRTAGSTDYVEELRLIEAPVADSLLLGAGDSADDGRAAGDAEGAVPRLQP